LVVCTQNTCSLHSFQFCIDFKLPDSAELGEGWSMHGICILSVLFIKSSAVIFRTAIFIDVSISLFFILMMICFPFYHQFIILNDPCLSFSIHFLGICMPQLFHHFFWLFYGGHKLHSRSTHAHMPFEAHFLAIINDFIGRWQFLSAN